MQVTMPATSLTTQTLQSLLKISDGLVIFITQALTQCCSGILLSKVLNGKGWRYMRNKIFFLGQVLFQKTLKQHEISSIFQKWFQEGIIRPWFKSIRLIDTKSQAKKFPPPQI